MLPHLHRDVVMQALIGHVSQGLFAFAAQPGGILNLTCLERGSQRDRAQPRDRLPRWQAPVAKQGSSTVSVGMTSGASESFPALDER